MRIDTIYAGLAACKRYEHYWPDMKNLTKLKQDIAVVKEAIECATSRMIIQSPEHQSRCS